jgi:hypothetical protein
MTNIKLIAALWAQLAYIYGNLGIVIGAETLDLAQIRGLRSPAASIGGEGTFDCRLVTGLMAVVFASIATRLNDKTQEPRSDPKPKQQKILTPSLRAKA